MKVAKNTAHNLRHDWINVSDEQGKVGLSILALRSELCVDVELNGSRFEHYFKPREVAEWLAKMVKAKDRRERVKK